MNRGDGTSLHLSCEGASIPGEWSASLTEDSISPVHGQKLMHSIVLVNKSSLMAKMLAACTTIEFRTEEYY